MNAPDDFTGPVNLGNPHEFTIRELAERIIALTGSRSQDRAYAVARRTIRGSAARTSRGAQELLDWQPRVPLKDWA